MRGRGRGDWGRAGDHGGRGSGGRVVGPNFLNPFAVTHVVATGTAASIKLPAGEVTRFARLRVRVKVDGTNVGRGLLSVLSHVPLDCKTRIEHIFFTNNEKWEGGSGPSQGCPGRPRAPNDTPKKLTKVDTNYGFPFYYIYIIYIHTYIHIYIYI